MSRLIKMKIGRNLLEGEVFISFMTDGYYATTNKNYFAFYCSTFCELFKNIINHQPARVFVPGKLFQPSLMFVDKVSVYPKEEAPFRFSTLE
jgi:hypothetical protein